MTLVENCFKQPYKILIDKDITPEYVTLLDWVNKNSIGTVQVKLLRTQKVNEKWVLSPVGHDVAFFAFDNEDDALMFRIKYGGNISSR